MHVLPPTSVLFSSVEDARAQECDMRSSLGPEPCLLSHVIGAIDTTGVQQSGDTLTFVLHASGIGHASVVGGVESELRQVSDDAWAASLYVPRANEAIINYRFLTDTSTVLVDREYRGADAPAPLLRSNVLHGSIRIDTLASKTVGARELTSYVPPGAPPKRGYDVVYATDGPMVRKLAAVLDTLIVDGHIKPTVIVGVQASPTQRSSEYVYGFQSDSTAFLAHESFFLNDVANWAESRLHVARATAAKTLFGTSNGGAFAVAMGLRHPQSFAHIIAGSPVWTVIPNVGEGTMPSFFITAGTFEETTRARAKSLADELKKRGAFTRFELTVGGHDESIWTEWFIRALNDR